MKYQALGNNVLLDIPYEAMYSPGIAGMPDMKLPKLAIGGVPLKVLSAGENITSLKVGDYVLLNHDSVSTIVLGKKLMILMMAHDIDIKLIPGEIDDEVEDYEQRSKLNAIDHTIQVNKLGSDFDLDEEKNGWVETKSILDSDNLEHK